MIENFLKSFEISIDEQKKIINNFHDEMEKGLRGELSSLKMLPTYTDIPRENIEGEFIALDFGGTNFRILLVKLNRDEKASETKSEIYTLDKELIHGDRNRLFGFMADAIKSFVEKYELKNKEELKLGYTFSFPIEQRGLSSGVLLGWSKEFTVTGVIGQDVVALLDEALRSKNINNIKITALINDTVGTMAARCYLDKYCSLGVILGTGTNACYREKISSITKLPGGKNDGDYMLINMEWGGFDKLRRTDFDEVMDSLSEYPGEDMMEKMISARYLGEIAKAVIIDFIKNKKFSEEFNKNDLNGLSAFNTENMSEIKSDSSENLDLIYDLLNGFDLKNSNLNDRKTIKILCDSIVKRSIKISAAAISAVILKIDANLSAPHTVAIDGSLFEKYPDYGKNLLNDIQELLHTKHDSEKIKLELTKDGSGIGAAIVAASI